MWTQRTYVAIGRGCLMLLKKSFPSKLVLANLKKKALRKGLWFRALTGIERGIVDLTIRLVKEPRSQELLATLDSIVRKLADAIQLGFLYIAETIGKPIAEQRVRAAVSWGHERAKEWLKDRSFAQFLGLMVLNDSRLHYREV